MFNLYYSDDVDKILRSIKKELRKLGYKEFKQSSNCCIGSMRLNYKISKFLKHDLLFEFTVDKNNNTISTRYYHYIGNKIDDTKEIKLADVLTLA